MTDFEAVIGLEIHCELRTKTKIFCSCSSSFGADPNTNVCPVCLGMPGTLPVLSGEAVRLAVMAGLTFGCDISRRFWFDRKNYFYPDLPKGYQITQFDEPVCRHGAVEFDLDGEHRTVRLTRIHLEEDAGKLIHRGSETLIDCNRCGVPLIEIVSEPDIRSADEAEAYVNTIRRTLCGLGISDCKMNEGSLRADVNVSVHRKGEPFGTKCEIKNINSVNSINLAVKDEINRQISVIESGGTVYAETRRYNEDTGHTELMRRKEENVDYRYFTEPDIPPVVLSEEYISSVRGAMPQHPDAAAGILTNSFGMRHEDAYLLTNTPELTDYVMRCLTAADDCACCTNLFIAEILPVYNGSDYISPSALAKIVSLFSQGRIVSGNAKKLLHHCAETGEDPDNAAERLNMLKITDEAVLRTLCSEVISKNEKSVKAYRNGKEAAMKALVGGVMRESSGRADPVISEKILIELIKGNANQQKGSQL